MQSFLAKVRRSEPVEFSETMAVIDANYHFQPTGFRIGEGGNAVINAADQNQGSCRILAFAQMHELTDEQTLALFGHHYRDDVLGDPDGTSHANIRAIVAFGVCSAVFDGQPLSPIDES